MAMATTHNGKQQQHNTLFQIIGILAKIELVLELRLELGSAGLVLVD